MRDLGLTERAAAFHTPPQEEMLASTRSGVDVRRQQRGFTGSLNLSFSASC
jgi:hypothetical protein